MTPIDAVCIFGLIALKHYVCDFPLQHYPYMWQNKHRFDHPGGYLHASIHLVGMLLILLLVTTPLTAFLLACMDGISHFFIDMFKMRVNAHFKLTPMDPWFYDMIGLDQIAHFSVYFVVGLFLL